MPIPAYIALRSVKRESISQNALDLRIEMSVAGFPNSNSMQRFLGGWFSYIPPGAFDIEYRPDFKKKEITAILSRPLSPEERNDLKYITSYSQPPSIEGAENQLTSVAKNFLTLNQIMYEENKIKRPPLGVAIGRS